MAVSIIDTGLRADVMRKRIEDKNTLQHKGSLYVGTGTYSSTEIDGITFKDYETTELYPASEEEFGLPIIADSNASLGIKFSKINGALGIEDGIISSDLIADHTINHEDLTLHNFPVSFLGVGNIISSSSSSIVLNGIKFQIQQTETAPGVKPFYVATTAGKWKNANNATRATSLTSSKLVGSDSR